MFMGFGLIFTILLVVGFVGSLGFHGAVPDVGATLVVALDWAGTRPAPTFSDTPRDPKDPICLLADWSRIEHQ